MKILISWSGPRSEALAKALHEWIGNVIPVVIEPWMSKMDIEMGVRWSPELSAQLEETKFGILCLTKENLDSKWVLFEAGALSKTKDTYVCPYLLDLKPTDIGGPLGQFQCAIANKEDTLKLIHSINGTLGEHALLESKINKFFDAFWEEFDATIKKISENDYETKNTSLSDDGKIEEILTTVRENSRILSEILMSSRSEIFIQKEASKDESLSMAKNIEQIEECLKGNGGHIVQGGVTVKILRFVINKYVQTYNKKKIRRGRAILQGTNMLKHGPAIGNFDPVDGINKYEIFINKTAICNDETNAVFFHCIGKWKEQSEDYMA